VVVLNGLFFFESIALELCRQRGIPAIVYERGFIAGTLLVHQGNPDTLLDIREDVWQGGEWALTPQEESELDVYLDDRRLGRRTLDQYWKGPGPRDLTAGGGTGTGRTVALFTNLTWDSAVLGQEIAFPSIHDWLLAAVSWAAANPEHDLIVRIHPAEALLPGKQTREPLGEFLRTTVDPMPANVRIMDADDPTSSYLLMEACDVGLVLTSTVGMELAVFGTPVIVAGRTHYRDKGFTIDVSSAEEFTAALDAAVADPMAHGPDVARARRYAYAFFFRAPMPAPYVEEQVPGLARITTDTVEPLLPGRDPSVDRLCGEILGAAERRRRGRQRDASASGAR
jgi:Capsule polysaccharide biosynthesis protein